MLIHRVVCAVSRHLLCLVMLLWLGSLQASSLFDEFHLGVGDRLNWDSPIGSYDYTHMGRITELLEGLGVNAATSGLNAKYIGIWMVPGWQESWFPAADVQRYVIDKGYVPVFIHWWFGDDTHPCTIIAKEADYYADLGRAADYLDQLSGEVLFLLEPEFNTTEAIKDSYPGSSEAHAVTSCADSSVNARFATFSMGELLYNGMTTMKTALNGSGVSLLYGTAPGTWDTAASLEGAMSHFATHADFVGVQSIHASSYHQADDTYDSADLALDRLIEYHQLYGKPTFVPYFAVSTYEDDGDASTSENEDGKRWNELQRLVMEQYRDKRSSMIEEAGTFGLMYMIAFDEPNHHGFFGAAEYYLGLADDEGGTSLHKKPAFDSFFSIPQQERHRLRVSNGLDHGELVYYGNRAIDTGTHEGVTRAVIAVHGVNRTPWSSYSAVIDAAVTEGRSGDTLVIAPWFQQQEDGPAADELYWGSNWSSGYDAQPQPGLPTLSSYAVMDQLATALFDRSHFPDLSDILIVGHSAGGQFVHRYAAATNLDVDHGDYNFRYVVANPGSYLYLDDTRPIGDDPENPFYALASQFVNPVTSGNGVPPEAETSACLVADSQGEYEYDEYQYGLVNRDPAPYMNTKTAQNLRQDYVGRELVYLLGTADTNRDHQYLARHCEADLQGYNRFQRGQNYLRHLNDLVARGVIPAHRHRLAKVLGVGHWSHAMYGSATGRAVLFGSLSDGMDDALEDADGDGFIDSVDNCPTTANDDQRDSDRDGSGNLCDATPFGGDTDGDGIDDTFDNCPYTHNPDQADRLEDGNGKGAGDGIGDACALVDELFYHRTITHSWDNGYCMEFTATYMGSQSSYDIPWGYRFHTAGSISPDPGDTWNAAFDATELPLIRFAGHWNVKDSKPVRNAGVCIINATEPTRPVITLLGDAEITLELGATFQDPGATAVDYFLDGLDDPHRHNADLTAHILIGGDHLNTSQPGSYTLTYQLSDSRGNEARELTRHLTVGNCATTPLTLGPADYTQTLALEAESTLATNGEVRIHRGANLGLQARQRITLNPGFQALPGSQFNARITSVSCGT